MTRTLVLIRHAKSDWEVPVSDRDRPLSKRGRHQAPPIGRWLSRHLPPLDLAVLSPARRARGTWDLLAAELVGGPPPVRVHESAYTFDGDDLLRVVHSIPDEVESAALVGHNPALEELGELLVGHRVDLPTSALAVVEVRSWADAGDGRGMLAANGRPADGRGGLTI